MREIERTCEIPIWAIGYLCDGVKDGLTETQMQMADEWKADHMVNYVYVKNTDEHCDDCPAFGDDGLCVTCMVAMENY